MPVAANVAHQKVLLSFMDLSDHGVGIGDVMAKHEVCSLQPDMNKGSVDYKQRKHVFFDRKQMFSLFVECSRRVALHCIALQVLRTNMLSNESPSSLALLVPRQCNMACVE